MVRKTTGYSKNLTNLKRTIALYVFHYNFCRIHKTLGTTPAIAAGIDDTRWEWEHFLDLIDAYTAEKRIAAKLPTDEQSIEPTCTEAQMVIEPSYFVYLSRDGDYAKVHHSSCKNARHGSGSSKQSGQFWLCETVGDALALAEEKAPGMAEKCKVCFSDYNTLSYRDPARRSSRPQPQRRIR